MLGDYLKVYKEADLTHTSFLLLVLMWEKNNDFLQFVYENNFLLYQNAVKILEEKGYIKQHGAKVEDYTMRKTGEELFGYLGKKKKIDQTDINKWIEQWRNLFPVGSNGGGYRYRGNRLEVLKKMTKFMSIYPYTREEIFEATENYVKRFAVRGYNYMQQAHYFIEKRDSGSNLASECEALKEQTNKTEVGYGGEII